MPKEKIPSPAEQALENETNSIFISDLGAAAQRIIDLSICSNCNGEGCSLCDESNKKENDNAKEKK